eukprot:GHVN01013918.1.p1 GENE.GHVN01013918.1~~GHVN01013918.1.p1  ORF type:complete len:142 (+),score=0.16 GHVN01013918.1:151-576(+)
MYLSSFVDPYDSVHYNSVEQYYQSHKAEFFYDHTTKRKIMKTSDPYQTRNYGRNTKNYNDEKWKRIRQQVMYDACMLKFEQNEELLHCLKRTNQIIAEASPRDRFWGIGRSIGDPKSSIPSLWLGKNTMGKILMRVRAELC